MLTDDSPEREFDVYDSESLPTIDHEESPSNLSKIEATISNRSNPMENTKPSRKPRREVWWLDLGTTNHSLTSVGRCFEDRLNWSLLSSSNSLLPHIRSPKDNNPRRNLHQCPGYLREEIALTCDLSKSVIVSHAFPGRSERCSICHQLVQYTYSDSISLSLPPTESALSSGQTPSSGTPLPDQQTRQRQRPATHVLASSDANNNQATLRLQLNKIGKLGSLIFGKSAKRGGMFGGDKSHQTSLPPGDETRTAVSFPSHAQSSSTGRRFISESSLTREQQLPAQDSREMKINKKEAERLRREKIQEEYKQQARQVLLKRQQLMDVDIDGIKWIGHSLSFSVGV